MDAAREFIMIWVITITWNLTFIVPSHCCEEARGGTGGADGGGGVWCYPWEVDDNILEKVHVSHKKRSGTAPHFNVGFGVTERLSTSQR